MHEGLYILTQTWHIHGTGYRICEQRRIHFKCFTVQHPDPTLQRQSRFRTRQKERHEDADMQAPSTQFTTYLNHSSFHKSRQLRRLLPLHQRKVIRIL